VAKRGSPEWRRKISEAKKGKKLSEEHRRRISEGLRERIRTSDEERIRRSKAMRGEKNPAKRPEVREKLSQAIMGEKNPMKRPEVREKFKGERHPMKRFELRERIRRATIENWKQSEIRERIIEAHRGKRLTEEHRKKISKGIKRYLDSLSYEELLARTEPGRRAAICTTSGTSLEQTVWKILDTIGIEYETQKQIGPYFVDIYIPSRNLIIECDGEWWHSRPEQIKYDRARDIYLKKRGYHLLRLPERIIKSEEVDRILKDNLLKEGCTDG
jgi:very-short-patch-repair endonuclease